MDRWAYIHKASRLRQRAVEEASRYLNNHEDIDDVAQNVMLKMWEQHERLLDDERMLRSYVTSAVRHACTDCHRARQRHPMSAICVEAYSEGVTDRVTPHIRMEADEIQALYCRAMSLLPDSWRSILSMRMEQDMSYKEIALVLGTTESSVRGMVSKGRMRLYNLINRMLG